MGLSVNTQDVFDYILEDRRALPPAEQPKLSFRYLSARDHARMERLFADAMAADDIETIVAKASEGISIGLVNWTGFDVPFEPGQPGAVLSRSDLMELVRELTSAMTIAQREKKASVLRSLSITDKSASETAVPANA